MNTFSKNFWTTFKALNWVSIGYLLTIPTVSLACLPWAISHGLFTWPIVVYAIIHYSIDCLSITVGYHRLISHKAYEANPLVKASMLVTGAGAFQNSALIWSKDHRVHHREVDTDNDPYSINKGFWYAHFFWMFFKEPPLDMSKVPPDLRKDTLVQWQHKYYLPLAIFMAFIVPMIVGHFLVGSILAGLYVGGFVRLFFSGHCTFAINSFAHMIGTRPYSANCTARDNWFLGILTFGEGYHNYHHRFQADYRNGLKWYAWDPSKWIIFCLSRVGLTHSLIRVPPEKVRVAKMETAELRLQEKGFDVANMVKQRMELLNVHQKIESIKADIEKYKAMGRKRMDDTERAVIVAYHKNLSDLKKAKKSVIRRWKSERKLIRSLPRIAM